MMTFEQLTFRPFGTADVETFAPLMKRAFDEDTRRHLGLPSGGPPGYEDGGFLRQFALDPAATSWAIFREGRPAGALITWIGEQGEHYLGNLFFDPEVQDQGLGLTAWRFLEARYPSARLWRTDTPGFSTRNHHFYVNKCGFAVVRIENPRDRHETTYHLEKKMPGASSPAPGFHPQND